MERLRSVGDLPLIGCGCAATTKAANAAAVSAATGADGKQVANIPHGVRALKRQTFLGKVGPSRGRTRQLQFVNCIYESGPKIVFGIELITAKRQLVFRGPPCVADNFIKTVRPASRAHGPTRRMPNAFPSDLTWLLQASVSLCVHV